MGFVVDLSIPLKVVGWRIGSDGRKSLKRGTDKCLYFLRWQFSVPRCNAHRAERQMGKRDEAHNTVATASRDRKGVFKWVSMRCTFLQPVQIPP
jgi:hypothetical protein